MTPPAKPSRFQFIGGAIIVVAAFAIMAPGLFVFIAGLGKMLVLIVMTIAIASFITYSANAAKKKAAAINQKDGPARIEKPVDTKIDS